MKLDYQQSPNPSGITLVCVSGPQPWQIVTPTIPVPNSNPARVTELADLVRAWFGELVVRGIYTREEMSAQEDPSCTTSWAPVGTKLYGPLTVTAVSKGRVVAGVELWQQQRDRFWYLEDLVRDQVPEFKGAGRDVVEAARYWWLANLAVNDYQLRVYAIEPGGIDWWADYTHRPPDLTGEHMRCGAFNFSAVGWILNRPPKLERRRLGARLSA